MHNKISLPGIAWSRKKNREKGALCFQERQKATYFYNRNCAAVFPDHRFRSPTLVDVGFYFDFYPDLFIKGGLI